MNTENFTSKISTFIVANSAAFTSILVFLVLSIFFSLLIKTRGRSNQDRLDAFLLEEHNANSVRRKSIENIYFLPPNVDKLPINDYGDIDENKALIKAQEVVLHKSTLKMIRFNPPKTNIDIKREFGYANLETITMYEEHFNQYISALVSWAKLLYEINELNSAKTILEYCIEIGAERSKCFILLTDIYFETNERVLLQDLLTKVDVISISSKHKVWAYINNKLDEM